jgi:hypothetical protein
MTDPGRLAVLFRLCMQISLRTRKHWTKGQTWIVARKVRI